MNRIGRNLNTIYRTERLITRRRMAVVRNQSILMAMAGLAALIGLVLINMSLFFLLQTRMSPAGAAGLLALLNVVIAGGLVAVAGKMSVEDEIAPAVEVRDMAIADLEAEVDEATQEVRGIANSLKGLHSDPLGSLSTFVIPLLSMLLKKKT